MATLETTSEPTKYSQIGSQPASQLHTDRHTATIASLLSEGLLGNRNAFCDYRKGAGRIEAFIRSFDFFAIFNC